MAMTLLPGKQVERLLPDRIQRGPTCIARCERALWPPRSKGKGLIMSMESLQGQLAGAPSAVAWDPTRLDVFAVGRDQGLWHWWRNDGGQWGGPEARGGSLPGEGVSAVARGPNRLDVFGVGGNNQLNHWAWNGASWSGPQALGGNLPAETVSAVAWDSNRLDVFAPGQPGNQLFHWSWNGANWSGPEARGGVLNAEGVSAVSWGPNRLDVFGVEEGTGQLLHWSWDGAWHDNEKRGGRMNAETVSAVSWGPNRLDVFGVEAGTGHLLHWSWDGARWNGPESLGGTMASEGVSAVSTGPNRLTVFGIEAGSGQLLRWTWDGTSWANAVRVSPDSNLPTGDVSGVSRGPNKVDVFARASDNSLRHWPRPSSSGRVAGFLPSQSGFHFSNSYPQNTPYPAVSLPIVGPIVAGDAGNGLCGGFVLAALDLFCHSPRLAPPPDTDRPPAGSPIFTYIVGRLMDSFGQPGQGFAANAARVVEWIHTPDEDVNTAINGPGLGRRVVEQEWPKIKADIDAGVPSPLNLVSDPQRGPVDVDGIVQTLHRCHQVLAYAYDLDAANNLKILVYDCNDPFNDDSAISLNLNSDFQHAVPMMAPAVSTHLTTGMNLRGFFRTQYQLHDPSGLAGTDWQVAGHANDVVGMAATGGKLFAATRDNKLWTREPALNDRNWQPIGHANGVVAMAATSNKLFCVTGDTQLWARDPVLVEMNWQPIGHAVGVVGLAAVGAELFCATKDGKLWFRPAILADVAWQPIGQAPGVVAMTGTASKLVFATSDNRLFVRDPAHADVPWKDIGNANDVVGLAVTGGTLFCATKDNKLWARAAPG